jgi:hypothetical protein
MNGGRLWAEEHRPIKPGEILRIYGMVFPHFVDYVRNELIEKHVHPRRCAYAREDVLTRADQLIEEALRNKAEAGRNRSRKGRAGGQKKVPKKRPAESRKRRPSRLPGGKSLLRQYESLLADLRELLPRRTRGEPIPKDAFGQIRERYPELGWKRRRDSVGATPAGTALEVLAHRHDSKPRAVLSAVRGARARTA